MFSFYCLYCFFYNAFTPKSSCLSEYRDTEKGAYGAFSTFSAWNFLFLLASAFFGWLAATDAYAVLDRHAASLAWLTSTGLAHSRNLLSSEMRSITITGPFDLE
jgi:hypothetical protein